MNKERMGTGGTMIGIGLIIWVWGRICGGHAVFAPLLAAVGVIVVMSGLFARSK